MKRFLLFVLLAALLLPMAGCVSNEPEDPNRVSTIPWNRPEKWEGRGPMGGFSPGTQ